MHLMQKTIHTNTLINENSATAAFCWMSKQERSVSVDSWETLIQIMPEKSHGGGQKFVLGQRSVVENAC